MTSNLKATDKFFRRTNSTLPYKRSTSPSTTKAAFDNSDFSVYSISDITEKGVYRNGQFWPNCVVRLKGSYCGEPTGNIERLHDGGLQSPAGNFYIPSLHSESYWEYKHLHEYIVDKPTIKYEDITDIAYDISLVIEENKFYPSIREAGTDVKVEPVKDALEDFLVISHSFPEDELPDLSDIIETLIDIELGNNKRCMEDALEEFLKDYCIICDYDSAEEDKDQTCIEGYTMSLDTSPKALAQTLERYSTESHQDFYNRQRENLKYLQSTGQVSGNEVISTLPDISSVKINLNQEEETMYTPLNMQEVHYWMINGKKVEEYSDTQLLSIIKDLQTAEKNMKELNLKSSRKDEMLEELHQQQDKIVEVLDSRTKAIKE